MSNDNKTLADVQPGGRVRLGDQAERARFEAWAHAQSYRGGNIMADRDAVHPDVYADPLAQLTWKSWKAALSAQPSPGGQGETLVTDAMVMAALQAVTRETLAGVGDCDSKVIGVLTAYGIDGAVDIPTMVRAMLEAALAARQPVGEHGESDEFLAGVCVALQCVTAQDCGVLWAEIVRAVGVDDLLQYATFIEPAEWDLAGFSTYALPELNRRRPRSKAAKQAKRPTAQAVDLGRWSQRHADDLHVAVHSALSVHAGSLSQKKRAAISAYVKRLLVDSQAVGK